MLISSGLFLGKYLNYGEHLLILVSTVTGCFSILSQAGIKICAITAVIQTYQSIIKKKKKKHDKKVLLAKSKLNSIKALISKSLTNSVICHDIFVVIMY